VSDVELAIAEYAAGFISEGSTLQTGFGSIPSTIATCLAERPGGHYGVHSEMFTTGLMRLHQAGKISNTRKSEFEGFSIATFAAGTEELYEWLDGRSDVRFAPVSVVNAPELIAANHNMVSINGAIAIDLFGQVIADTIGGHQYSGIGGHEDFVAGTGLELEDRSLLCLPSAVTAGDAEISRIVGELDSGSVVTTPRHQVDVVITEHGVAELRGRDVRERAIALAAIAHPSSRDYLRGLIEKDPRFA
jgi:acyl-CoA hydrolase